MLSVLGQCIPKTEVQWFVIRVALGFAPCAGFQRAVHVKLKVITNVSVEKMLEVSICRYQDYDSGIHIAELIPGGTLEGKVCRLRTAEQRMS